MAFNPDTLKDILVCPRTKSKLVFDDTTFVCTDAQCRLRFEIRDEIPIMLVDAATELPLEEWKAVMQRHGVES